MNSAAGSNAIAGNKVVWIGSFPAHYIRVFHCRVEEMFPGQVEFIYLEAPRPQRYYEKGALPSACCTVSDSLFPWVMAGVLARLRPCAIIVSGYNPWPLLHAALWGFARNCPVLYWADTNVHDVLSRNVVEQWARRLFFRVYLKKMYRLLYPGTRTREFYSWACGGNIGTNRLMWLPIPEIASRTTDPDRRGNKDGLFRVLYLGRLDAVKGVVSLVRAFGALPPAVRKKSRLCIAGDGPEMARIKELVAELSLEDDVELPGSIPSDATYRLFRDASIFVLPSNREPWGLVVNEALAAGLPVIVPHWVGAAADLVVDGQTGIVLRDNSPEEIARAIMFLFENPDSVNRMGQAGRRLIEEGRWNLEGAVDAFSKIMGELPQRS